MFSRDFELPPEAACFQGHFPGKPIAPGAYLLNLIANFVEQSLSGKRLSEISKVKFNRPLEPGVKARLELEILPNESLKFSISSGEGILLQGRGSLLTAA